MAKEAYMSFVLVLVGTHKRHVLEETTAQSNSEPDQANCSANQGFKHQITETCAALSRELSSRSQAMMKATKLLQACCERPLTWTPSSSSLSPSSPSLGGTQAAAIGTGMQNEQPGSLAAVLACVAKVIQDTLFAASDDNSNGLQAPCSPLEAQKSLVLREQFRMATNSPDSLSTQIQCEQRRNGQTIRAVVPYCSFADFEMSYSTTGIDFDSGSSLATASLLSMNHGGKGVLQTCGNS
jgi:hypothetical protein